MNTSFRSRRIEDELGLTILLQHGIVAGDDDRTIRIPTGGNAQSKEAEVDAEKKQGRSDKE